MKKRIQNKIAESRWTFPIALGYGILVAMIQGLICKETILPIACVFLATLLMVEFNNRFALIRIYSRMVSTSFLLMTMMSPQLLSSPKACVAQVAFIGFYIIFFMGYQNRNAAGVMFYSFFIVGILSVLWVQALYFIPLLWIMMANNNMAGSIRNIMASILGVMSPYWFLTPYYIYKGDLEQMWKHFVALGKFGAVASFSSYTTEQLCTLSIIITLFAIGTVHFVRSSYLDKIRIRMTYNTLIIAAVAAIVFLILQPQHYDMLIRIILVSTAALIAHFFTLTHTRFTNISFIAIVTGIILMTAYNLITA